MLNTTQYYLPLSTSSTSFTWGYPITLTNAATINNTDADTLELAETIVKVDGDLVITGTVYPTCASHLFIYFADSTVSKTYSTSWAHLTNDYDSLFIQAELNNSFTISNDTITAINGGGYNFDGNFAHDGDNGETVFIRFYNVTQAAGIPVAGATTCRAANNFSSTPVVGHFDVDAGDKIVVQYKGDADGTSVFKNGIVRIIKIHN